MSAVMLDTNGTADDFSVIGKLDYAGMTHLAKNDNPHSMQTWLDRHIPSNEGLAFNTKALWAALCLSYHGVPMVVLRPGQKVLPGKQGINPNLTTGQNYAAAMTSPATVRKALDPHKGKYRGYNIGIACGQHPAQDSPGIGAIDIDKHGVNGFIGWKALENEYGHIISGPVQTTPNDGKHLLLLWVEGFDGGANRLAPGVDIKGGKPIGRPSGHICTYPSIFQGKQYKWEGWSDPQVPPTWVLDKLKRDRPDKISSAPIIYPLHRLVNALKSVDPEKLSYQEWCEMGMALHSQYPNDDGLAAWDEWSKRDARSGKYEEGACAAKWSSFDPEGGITVGTLIHKANEGGFQDSIDVGRTIIWNEHDIGRRMDAVEDIIAKEQIVFQRGPELVQITKSQDKNRTLYIIAANQAMLREVLSEYVVFTKRDDEGEKVIITPPKAVEHFLNRSVSWRQPVLDNFVEAPVLLFDDTILDEEGYHSQSRLWFQSKGVEFPPIPERPTKEDAQAAAQRLLHPISEYSFETSACVGAWLSAVLTALDLHSLEGVIPAYLVSAHQAGEGKSKLQLIIAIIKTGIKDNSPTAWVVDEKELEKRLYTFVSQGDTMITFDNIERGSTISGNVICAFITQPTMKSRTLGVSEGASLPTNTQIFMNGNNLTVAGDLAQRCVHSKIQSTTGRPFERPFEIDPERWCIDNRGQLVVDALTLLRAYRQSNDEMKLSPSRFRLWDKHIRAPIVWALGDEYDPGLTMIAMVEEDPLSGGVRVLYHDLFQVFGNQGHQPKEMAIVIATGGMNHEVRGVEQAVIEESCANIREKIAQLSNKPWPDDPSTQAQYLGSTLRKVVGQIEDGMQLVKEVGHKKTTLYRMKIINSEEME